MVLYHTWASQRTTAITRSLYSSILSGGNKKCLRAYSCMKTQKKGKGFMELVCGK